jgi:glucosamine 6-phosphate synthetase-like amidotransferase/phosphosugar isomerase protein
MACGLAKAAVAASYAGLVASLGVEFASAGTLTFVAAAGIVFSLAGLIASLVELHTCLVQQDKLDEAHKIQQQIDQLTREKQRLEQLIHH